jgi:hypothetical protein
MVSVSFELPADTKVDGKHKLANLNNATFLVWWGADIYRKSVEYFTVLDQIFTAKILSF